MTIYRGLSGVNREIKQQYRGVGGVSREIKEQYRGYGGVNRKVFSGELVVYDNGDAKTAITSGWTGGRAYADYPNTGVGVLAATRMEIRGAGFGSYGFISNNLIDLSAYGKIIVEMEQSVETYIGVKLTPVGTIPQSDAVGGARVVHMDGETGRVTKEADISAISSAYVFCTAAYIPWGYIYKIRFE